MNSNHPSSRKRNRRLAALVLTLLFHAGVANVEAAGLGRLNVLSKLGQPFAAEIDLINVSREDLVSLKVGLASPAAYQAAGLRFDPALNALRLSVERRANGTPYIRATSHYRVTEPYLDLLVEINAQDGKFQRGYAALLDLPESAVTAQPSAAQAQAPASAPRAEAVPAPAPSRPRVPAPAPAPAPAPVVIAPAAPKPVMPAAPANNAVAQIESKPVEPAKVEPLKPAPSPTAAEPAKPETQEPAGAPLAETPASVAPAPKVVAPPVAAAVPPPGILDTLKNYLWPIAGLVLAGLGALWALRRRKPVGVPAAPIARATGYDEPASADATMTAAPAVVAPSVVSSVAPAVAAPAEPTVANVTDMVDPIDEARVYLDHGRDEQAEKILRDALNREPGREDIQVVLLEILAARGDKDGFNRLARNFHKQTGGQGGHWKSAMAMGYALDPAYPLYSSTEATAVRPPSPAAAGLDIDLDSAASAGANDAIDFPLSDSGAADDMDKTMALTRPGSEPAAPALKPLPDMNFELPPASVPHPYGATAKPATAAAHEDAKLDFEVDFSAVKSPWDDAPAAAKTAASAADDAKREAMQQKLDLASAYREMGDKEAALELLHEVERDGNAAHQTEARKIIQSLG